MAASDPYTAQPTTRSNDERVVVVMGPTGSGKTTLINCIAERENDDGVGHTILPCTTKVELVKVTKRIHDRKLILIDTPGFDDPGQTDLDVLTEIADFLVGTYKTALQVDTIFYLHRIYDKRMTRSLLKNLKMFVKLCGIQSMPSVVIVTTMWDDIDARKREQEQREEELKRLMWFDMIDNGCEVKRFNLTYDSAIELLAHRPKTAEGPLLCSEMVEQGKKLKETAAGTELTKELLDAHKTKKKQKRKLKERFKQAKDKEQKASLEEEVRNANEGIKVTEGQLDELKPTVFERLFGSKKESKLVPRVGSSVAE